MSLADEPYTPLQQVRLLGLARAAVLEALEGRVPDVEEPSREETYLLEPRGCFVTVRRSGGGLRGCVGTVEADHPLWVNVVRMGAAVPRDPRFAERDPLRLAEADHLRIELSVLTRPEPLTDPMALRVGVEGLVIEGRCKGRPVRGCFLPTVALERGWDAEQLLSACCAQKLQLPADAWRRSDDLHFFRFRCAVVEERTEGSGA